MCKTSKTLFPALLLCLALLAGCGQSPPGGNAQPSQESDGAQETAHAESQAPESNTEEPEAFTALPDTLATILGTYSAKDFVAGEVAAADLESILLAGAAAPSARNGQPWHFVAVTSPELVAELNFQEGMALVVVCGETAQQEGVVVEFDCALATQNMYLAARALGYGAHIYTGPVRTLNEMRDWLRIPEGYDPVALLAVGHEDDTVDVASSASVRMGLSETVTYVD